MGDIEKGCELQLGAIVNKIEISNLKISLINYFDTPPNPPSTNMLEISESGVNIHLARQATPAMSPVICKMKWKKYYQIEALWIPYT